jgi:hypothetical protein
MAILLAVSLLPSLMTPSCAPCPNMQHLFPHLPLPPPQLLTRQDPYVRLCMSTPYHRCTQETLPVWGGGVAPRWREVHRNALHMDFVGEENGTMTLRVSAAVILCVRPVAHAVFRILRLCGLFFDLLVAGAPAVLPWARVSVRLAHARIGDTHRMVQLGGDSAVPSAGPCLARSPTPPSLSRRRCWIRT